MEPIADARNELGFYFRNTAGTRSGHSGEIRMPDREWQLLDRI
jgi:hypothetical protein